METEVLDSKQDDISYAGKRVSRWLLCTAMDQVINTDSNASANILRKAVITIVGDEAHLVGSFRDS